MDKDYGYCIKIVENRSLERPFIYSKMLSQHQNDLSVHTYQKYLSFCQKLPQFTYCNIPQDVGICVLEQQN